MSEFADLKEEIAEWDADEVVEAIRAVKKARSKDAVREALTELQSALEQQREAIQEELSAEQDRVAALETAEQSVDELLSNVESALGIMEGV